MAKRPLLFYGWVILGCAVLVMALASGTRMSFGIAMLPLSEHFGWTRTMLSTIALLTGIIGGLLQMVMDLLVDRYGARRLLSGGVAPDIGTTPATMSIGSCSFAARGDSGSPLPRSKR